MAVDPPEQLPDGLRERGKRRRVAQILEASRQLLRDTPDKPLTVERIAALAEVSPPTVFNLVGAREDLWAALADDTLSDIDFAAFVDLGEPEDRAVAAVDALLSRVTTDGAVFRALVANWRHSAVLLDADPTGVLCDWLCEVTDDVTARPAAEFIASGLVGVLHQWAAGVVTDAGAFRCGRDLVELAFRAARTVEA
jgi:AcrR family transcriptional regulator